MCTIFAKREEEGLIIGRSFDWVQLGGNINFLPPYRSYGTRTIGTCFIEQLGEDKPYEGINERGLLVAVVALPTIREEKRELSPLIMNCDGMVRFILERASTVDEALYIIKQFTLDYGIKYGLPKVQYFFADSDDKVGIYEEGVYEESVDLKVGEYRMLTNQSVTSDNGCIRYNKIKAILDEGNVIDEETCMEISSKAKQEYLTAWTSVYNLKKKEFILCVDQNFDIKYRFNIEKCLRKGRYSMDFAELKLNSKVMNRKRNDGFFHLDTF
ncbi:linear amide C-N hydrolase [Tissierella creatinini]|nr:linear amide C-N hydrolase [Tissierella creatinini]TJX66335.1 linear amide C-N hydrolase [Soehngenia saccharolytica]